MLGRAGLAGIGAYDEAAASEAAKAEGARKAGLEERGIGLQGRQVAAQELKVSADIEFEKWKQTHPKATMQRVDVGDKTGYAIYDEQGKVLKTVLATETQKRGAGAGGGGIGDMADLALKSGETAYQDIWGKTHDVKLAEEGRQMAIDSYRNAADPSLMYVPPEEGIEGGWFEKGTPKTEGRYVPRATSSLSNKDLDAEIAKLKTARKQ